MTPSNAAVFTAHGTVVVVQDGQICHVPLHADTIETANRFALQARQSQFTANDGAVIEPRTSWDGVLTLTHAGLFGCAERERADLVFNRPVVGAWECFEIRAADLNELVEVPSAISHDEFTRFIAGSVSVLDARSQSYGPVRVTESSHALATYDRIAITAGASFETVREQITRALSILAPDGLLLIDRCGDADVSRAIVASACEGLLQPIVADGLRQTPRFQVLRRSTNAEHRSPERRIILVAAYGERSRREWRISRALILAYAQRVGAELILVEGELDLLEQPLAKMHALDRIEGAARVLLVDTDVLIRPDAPDLFSIVPAGSIGVFIESLSSDRAQTLADACHRFKVAPCGPHYANTGVLLLPPPMASRLRASQIDRTMYIGPMYEQDYFNAIFHETGFETFNISAMFNCIPALSFNLVSSAYFLHYAGGSIHLQSMEMWEQGTGSGGHALRVLRQLTAKDLRLFDMWNARASLGRPFDRLWQPTLFRTRMGELVLHAGNIRYDGPAAPGHVVTLCDFGALPAGDVMVEFLLDAESLDRTLGLRAGDAPSGSPVASVEFELIASAREPLTICGATVCSGQGIARQTVSLPFVHSVGCRIYGQERPQAIYGIRIRSFA